jgi:EmrB/QacA subfamily drug resistance transporter
MTETETDAPVGVSRVTAGLPGGPGLPGLRHRWGALAILLTGSFIFTLDFFIVNVAIPSMQRELHANAAAVQFIVAGYGVATAAGLITGGRLGDLFGRRRMFFIGLALFCLASAACGLAPTSAVLVLARVVQGLAAALFAPQVLAILGVAYQGRDRIRAFTAYGLSLGLAAVCGQLIGGLLIQADVAGSGWRSVFLVNVPVGAAALLLTPRLVPESRVPGGRLDLVGVALVTLGLVAIVLPLVEGRQQGWPAWTWACLAASAPLLLAFAAWERRLSAAGGSPLIDLALFRQRAFTVGVLAALVFFAGMASFFLVLALYLQQGRGLSALASGVVFTAIGVGYFGTTLCAGRLAARFGPPALAAGALILAAGAGLLSVSIQHLGPGGHIAWLVPALVVDGAGMGLVLAPLNSTVLAGLAPRYAGTASGVLTTVIQVGNALGVALIGIIFFGALGRGEGYADAMRASLVYLVALAVAVAALLLLLPRSPRAGSRPERPGREESPRERPTVGSAG